MVHCLPNESARRLQLIYNIPSTQILNEMHITSSQGGRSCAKARWAFTEKFGFGRTISAKTYVFVGILRYIAIHALFGRLWPRKGLFGSKTVFLGKEVHYHVVYIAYQTELNLQICDYAPDENFYTHFCPRPKAAIFCHPASSQQ